MGKNIRYKVVAFVLMVGVMIIIYSLSAQTATHSAELSRPLAETFVRVVNKMTFLPEKVREAWIRSPRHYVRKAAHIGIYGVLGAATLLALWCTPLKRWKCLLVALGLCVIYAATDEWHQYYVEGRGAQLSDVFLDSVGASIGIILMQLIGMIRYGLKRCILRTNHDKATTKE